MSLSLVGHEAMNEVVLKLVAVLQSNSQYQLSYCLWLPNIQYIYSCHMFNFILCFLWKICQNAWLSSKAQECIHMWRSKYLFKFIVLSLLIFYIVIKCNLIDVCFLSNKVTKHNLFHYVSHSHHLKHKNVFTWCSKYLFKFMVLSLVMMFQAKRTGEPHCYGSCCNSAETFEGAIRDIEKVQSKWWLWCFFDNQNVASPIWQFWDNGQPSFQLTCNKQKSKFVVLVNVLMTGHP